MHKLSLLITILVRDRLPELLNLYEERQLAVNLIYGFSSKRINMKAHLGGLLGGACLTMLMI